MYTTSAAFFVNNEELRKIIAESTSISTIIKNNGIFNNKHQFIEKSILTFPDFVMVDLLDENEDDIESFLPISATTLIIGICKSDLFALKLMDKGFIDVIINPTSTEDFSKKFLKILNLFQVLSRKILGTILVQSPTNPHPYFGKRFAYPPYSPLYEAEKSILLNYKGVKSKIYLEEIVFVSSLNNLITIHTVNKEKYNAFSSLKAIHEKIGYSLFIRINKETVINYKFITSFSSKEVEINKEYTFEVTRVYSESFKEFIKDKF